jgi:hypothetical protein
MSENKERKKEKKQYKPTDRICGSFKSQQVG